METKLTENKELREKIINYLEKEEKKELFAEIKSLELKKIKIIEKIKGKIIEEEKISQNIMVEIRPGPGGEEAGLFVNDLYGMYAKFAGKKGWKVEMVESKVGYKGNFSSVSFLIKGKGVFNCLKNEAGVHRVQRVPLLPKLLQNTLQST